MSDPSDSATGQLEDPRAWQSRAWKREHFNPAEHGAAVECHRCRRRISTEPNDENRGWTNRGRWLCRACYHGICQEWFRNSREHREAVRERYGALFDQTSAILYRLDPMRLNYEVNPDEYEPETGTILPRLESVSSEVEALDAIHEEFVRWFSPASAGPEGRYRKAAGEIWAAWVEWRDKMETEDRINGNDPETRVQPLADAPPTLDELLARVTEDNVHPEVDYGPPCGKELA